MWRKHLYVFRLAVSTCRYLSAEALGEILALDDGDAVGDTSHKVLGARLRAEKQFALEEELLLGEEENSGEGIAGLESDEGDAE